MVVEEVEAELWLRTELEVEEEEGEEELVPTVEERPEGCFLYRPDLQLSENSLHINLQLQCSCN